MKTKIFLPIVILLCIQFLLRFEVSVSAQGESQWSIPKRIIGLDDNTRPPILVVENLIVHAFDVKQFGNNLSAIVYFKWSPEQGWTNPNDILLPPVPGQLVVLDSQIDKNGQLHLIFFVGDDVQANIYYSKAYADQADKAQSWTTPIVIADDALPPAEGAFFIDQNGYIHVVYSGKGEGNGIYEIYSSDGGDNWSEPQVIGLTYNDEDKPYSLKVIQDQQGKVHAVWSVVDVAGKGQVVNYARYDPDQNRWINPIPLATAIGAGSDTPTIAEYAGKLFVVYHNDFPTTRWLRTSSDGGQTWTNPLRIFPMEGSNGPASLVIDSNNVLHMFFGNRTGNPAIHGLWHTVWSGFRWNEPSAIISGPRVIDFETGKGFDPSFAKAVVLQGNLILVTWRTDPGAGGNGIWYSYSRLDAPMLAPTAYSAPVLEHTLEASNEAPTETPIANEIAPQRLNPINSNPPSFGNNPAAGIMIGIVPVFLLVVIIIIVKKYGWVNR